MMIVELQTWHVEDLLLLMRQRKSTCGYCPPWLKIRGFSSLSRQNCQRGMWCRGLQGQSKQEDVFLYQRWRLIEREVRNRSIFPVAGMVYSPNNHDSENVQDGITRDKRVNNEARTHAKYTTETNEVSNNATRMLITENEDW